MEAAYSSSTKSLLRRQLLQQRLRLFQIARVEPLREPPVHRSQQFSRLLHLALVAPEPSGPARAVRRARSLRNPTQRLVQFAGKPSDFTVFTGRR